MIPKKKLHLIFICILSLFTAYIVTSCGAVKRSAIKNITVENEAIPPEFSGEDLMLVLLEGNESYDKYAEKLSSKFYHGNFEYMNVNDFKNQQSELNDGKYRYVFYYDTAIATYSSGVSGGTTDFKRKYFYVFDIMNNTKYQFKTGTSFWSKVMQAYFINLEEQRKN